MTVTRSDKRGTDNAQTFTPLFSSRKRKIVGLWQGGSRYEAQLRVRLNNGTTAPADCSPKWAT